MPTFKRSAVKRNTSIRRQAATLRAAQADLFTSDQRERLHPPSHKATVDKQARLLEFGEDVKKRLRLLSEERLSPREVKPCGDLRHFFDKKMAGGFFIFPRYSEQRFELKNSEFGCEMKF